MKRLISAATLDDKRDANNPYRYITKHGLGPGTLPKDVELIKWEDLDNYKTAIWLDRPLSTQELRQYDIYPENIQESTSFPVSDDSDDEVGSNHWQYVTSKSVPDSDGFLTEYTMYKNSDGEYICMFGDNELYPPDAQYADGQETQKLKHMNGLTITEVLMKTNTRVTTRMKISKKTRTKTCPIFK
jgi:hypothetical protein